MAVDEKNLSKLFLILSHKLRREILVILLEKKEQSFSELMNALNVDTGKLSFHLRKLKLFLEQGPTGKYRLNGFGRNALRLIKDMEALSIEADFFENKNDLNLASFSKRTMSFIIDMGVAFTITIAASLFTLFSGLVSGQYSLEFNILLFLFLLWIYSTLLEGFAGQTLGKSLLRLKVVSVGGKKLFYDITAVRNFGKCFLLPLDLLLGLRLDDKRYIKFFDKFSGTTVIKV